jgi:hypothetical protein
MDTLNIALDFVDLNPDFYIFPLAPRKKTPPLIDDNLRCGSADPHQLREWHAKHPGCNWGISLAQSNALVADVDNKAGKKGEETYDLLDVLYGWPKTRTVITPSGGRHLYYRGVHAFGLGKYGFGPDMDSPNYVLIPGCTLVGAGGGTYVDQDPSVPYADVPEWFYQYLKSGTAEARDFEASQDPLIGWDSESNIAWAVHFLLNDAPYAIMGEAGDKTTVDVAAVLKDHAISEPMAQKLMAEHYNIPPICDPLWDLSYHNKNGLYQRIRSAYKYLTKSQPGTATAEVEFAKHEEEPPTDADKEAAAKDEKVKDKKKAKLTERALFCEGWVYVEWAERFFERDDLTQKPWTNSSVEKKFSGLKRKVGKTKERTFTGAIFENQYPQSCRKANLVTYKPHKDWVEFPTIHGKPYYNIYRPSDVVPCAGDTTFWHEHLKYLFPDQESRDHVLNWCAWLVQNLHKKPMHALLIAGRQQGTGKSFISGVLGRIVGKHNTSHVDQNGLDSQFNEWAQKAKLITIEELRALDKGKVKLNLHHMITQETIQINDKNEKRHEIDTCFGILGNTNDDAAIPLEDGDRRYLVVRTEADPLDKSYYLELFAKLGDPAAMGAVAFELLNRKLGDYSGLGRAPETAAKQAMKVAGLTPLQAHLHEHRHEEPFCHRVLERSVIEQHIPNRLQQGNFALALPAALRRIYKAEPWGQAKVDGRKFSAWVTDWRGQEAQPLGHRQVVELYWADRNTEPPEAANDDVASEFGEEGSA